jgi:hypothetical protein
MNIRLLHTIIILLGMPLLAYAQATVIEAELQIDDRLPEPLAMVVNSGMDINYQSSPTLERAFYQADFVTTISTTDLSIGPHTYAVRVADSEGRFSDEWIQPPFGPGDKRQFGYFRVEGDQTLIGAQYYFSGNINEQLSQEDLDSVTPVDVEFPSDGTWDDTVEEIEFNLDSETLNSGQYYIYVRYQDADENWSKWIEGAFGVAPPLGIQAAEIVIDPNAPFGSGIPMTVGIENDEGEFPLEAAGIDLYDFDIFTTGSHPVLYIRAQDNLNFHINYPVDSTPLPEDRGRWSDSLTTFVVLNRCAQITSFTPSTTEFIGGVNKSLIFRLDVEDPDGDDLPEVRWQVNGQTIDGFDGNEFTFVPPSIDRYEVTATLLPENECGDMVLWVVNAQDCDECDPTQPFLRPILHVKITIPSTTTQGGSVQYTYLWQSSGPDPDTTNGPTNELEDTLAESDMITFDPGEVWTVTVTPESSGFQGDPFIGTFIIGDDGITVTFQGWTLF